MQDQLKEHIEHIHEITIEKERIGAELNVASSIQTNYLPNVFPALPEYSDQINIYATLKPAKEVGGDFYDFFMVDKTHLANLTKMFPTFIKFRYIYMRHIRKGNKLCKGNIFHYC